MAETRIEMLKRKRDAFDAKIKLEESKKSEKKRKKQTVVKILLGQAVLDRLERKDEKAPELYSYCRSTLTPRDRNRLDKEIIEVIEGFEDLMPMKIEDIKAQLD